MCRKVILLLFVVFFLFLGNVFGQSREEDSLALVDLYNNTDGDNWTNNTNWKSGTIDTWYGVTVSGDRVTALSLVNNNLVGTLPSSIGNLTSLTYLYLSFNQLAGTIPSEIGNLASLRWLRLLDNQFTGPIPSGIGNLTNLLWLYLGGNDLTGSIPPEIGDLEDLEDLQLHGNELTNSIPAEIGDLTNLTKLYLFNNQLEGSIPSEIANMTSLQSLILNNNQFTGSVPIEIADLSSLSHMHIYNNDLVNLPDLSSLSELWIQNNKFTFEDIEPNIGISHFNYSPQDSVGSVKNRSVTEGSNLTISVSVGGTSNQYQWKKNGSVISGATNHSYTIYSAKFSDAGSYICEITNTVATALTLYARPINVTVNPAPPQITVVCPNGGEDWKVDSTYDITWNSNGTSGDVNIEYSVDNGSVWVELIASIPDTGIYSWTIPNTPSDSCMVRISDTEGDPTDVSDSVFSISTSSAVPEDKLPQVYAMSVKTPVASNKFKVRYSIPEKTSITLAVYNINGTKIKEFREEKSPGIYSKEIYMDGSPAGAYFIKIEANKGKFRSTEKIVLVN